MKAIVQVNFKSPYAKYNNQEFEVVGKNNKFTTLNINGVETDFLNSEILICNPYNTLKEFELLGEIEISNLPYFLLGNKLVTLTNTIFIDGGSGEEYFVMKEKDKDFILLSFNYEPDCDGAYYSSYFIEELDLRTLDKKIGIIHSDKLLSLLQHLDGIHNGENSKQHEAWGVISNENVVIRVLSTKELALEYKNNAAFGYYKDCLVEPFTNNIEHWVSLIQDDYNPTTGV